jgi:hypothetical protein
VFQPPRLRATGAGFGPARDRQTGPLPLDGPAVDDESGAAVLIEQVGGT